MLQDLFTVRDLFGVAFEDASSVIACRDIEELSLGSKVLDILSNGTRVHAPSVLCYAAVEERMHDVYGLVGQFVCLCDPLVAHHLNDEPAIGFIILILQTDFTALNRSIPA